MSNITAIAWQEQAICEKMIMMFAFYKINRLNLILIVLVQGRGGSRGAHPAHAPPPPLKLEKIRLFGVKSRFFTRNTQENFAPPSARPPKIEILDPPLQGYIFLQPFISTSQLTFQPPHLRQFSTRIVSKISLSLLYLYIHQWKYNAEIK
jgi:hypothetical protein